jgi:hypothetical protein
MDVISLCGLMTSFRNRVTIRGMRSVGWKILGPIIALIVLYYFMSAMGIQDILDMHFYYSPAEATRFFTGLTEAQANLYLRHELLDLLFLSSLCANNPLDT